MRRTSLQKHDFFLGSLAGIAGRSSRFPARFKRLHETARYSHNNMIGGANSYTNQFVLRSVRLSWRCSWERGQGGRRVESKVRNHRFIVGVERSKQEDRKCGSIPMGPTWEPKRIVTTPRPGSSSLYSGVLYLRLDGCVYMRLRCSGVSEGKMENYTTLTTTVGVSIASNRRLFTSANLPSPARPPPTPKDFATVATNSLNEPVGSSASGLLGTGTFRTGFGVGRRGPDTYILACKDRWKSLQ